MITATRGANLQDMVDILREQRARRHDVVVSSDKIKFVESKLVLEGFEPMVDDDGITTVDGIYHPTDIFDGDMAEWLGVPPQFVRQLRSGNGEKKIPPRPDLYDSLMNGYLQGRKPKTRMVRNYETNELEPEIIREGIEPNPRLSLLRLFVSNDGTQNIARTRRSNRFAVMDNLDACMAVLAGIQAAGLDPSTLNITGDLSETRMYLKVGAPEIFTLAPELLAGYQSPFNDPGVAAQRTNTFARQLELGAAYNQGGAAAVRAIGGDDITNDHVGVKRGMEPIVFAGFIVGNSEVGQGKYTITPSVTVMECMNGQVRQKDAMERTHLGASLSEGKVEWSSETMKRNLDLVSSMTADAVTTFLSKTYLDTAVEELTAKATKPLGAKAREVIETVLKHKTVAFDDTAIAGILDHFIMGGQRTSGGLLQAITSYSQTVESADEAYELDTKAVAAMELAYAAV